MFTNSWWGAAIVSRLPNTPTSVDSVALANEGSRLTIGTIIVDVVGTDLPGRRCGPDPQGIWYENIHVGPARGPDTVDLVPGDAATAHWSFDVAVKKGTSGELDFGGPFVAGPRDGRYLGLRWLRQDEDGRFVVFRGAKFRLYEMEPDLFRRALEAGHRLVAKVNLTDENGWPRCATVRPPHVTWSVEPPHRPAQ